MKLIQTAVITFFLLLSLSVYAQEKSTAKFGSVTEKDFANTVYQVDSNANAVVIADIGSSEIEGNTKGWFSLVFKHYKRIHILNKNAYDLANVSIPLYTNGDDEEQLEKVKAVTYNLENGKVVETKLDVKANIFKDKINKNKVIKKFTFPNVKEGSIIEYEYTITSDFLYNLQPWEFQGAYPRLWSEYNLSLPEFLGYVFLTQGYKKFDISEKKDRSSMFSVLDSRGSGTSERYNINAGVSDYHWVMKNVPALKEEKFTSTIDNHISKIEFQMSEYKYPLTYRSIMGTWPKLTEMLMNDDQFGKQVTRDNGWLKDDVGPLKSAAKNKTETLTNIYNYVRDHYTCTDHSALWMEHSLKDVVRTHSGSVAEINLLLLAMLKNADIDADPVILSTRSHGFTYSVYPLLSQYNYVIARAVVDGKTWYLDATEPHLGIGHLPIRCYNGNARIVNKEADITEFTTDSLKEEKNTSIFIINDEKGNLIGSMQQTPGYYESFDLRDRIKDKGKDELQKDIKKDFGTDVVLSNFVIDSLEKLESSIVIKYDFDIKDEKEDIMYLNPMFGEATKENPFKSAERRYPVEMPYTFDETYTLQLEVPHGYVVDELPQSVVVKLNEENEGMFEYRISQSGENISFRSRIRISRSYFLPEEYEMLREFFNLIVKKHAEQIVFKKKK